MYSSAKVLLILNIVVQVLCESPYFLQSAKNVPRIGRSNNNSKNIDEMSKFLMKASKSVPRIGRQNDESEVEKREQWVSWADLPDKFEYNPEEILERLEMGDDPSAYSWNAIRVKRDNVKPHPKFYRFM